MSTKSSIEYGKIGNLDLHLYAECFEDDAIYLEIEGKFDYEAGPNHLTVRIPLDFWEVMRAKTHPILNHEYVGKTDDELRAIVDASVAERIKEYKAGNHWPAMSGILSYGKVTDSRKKQVERGLASAIELRDRIAVMQSNVAGFYKKQEAENKKRRADFEKHMKASAKPKKTNGKKGKQSP